MEQINLNKINNDLQYLKKAVGEIKIALNIEQELRDDVKQQIIEAEERIDNGEFITHEEMLKKFGLECLIK